MISGHFLDQTKKLETFISEYYEKNHKDITSVVLEESFHDGLDVFFGLMKIDPNTFFKDLISELVKQLSKISPANGLLANKITGMLIILHKCFEEIDSGEQKCILPIDVTFPFMTLVFHSKLLDNHVTQIFKILPIARHLCQNFYQVLQSSIIYDPKRPSNVLVWFHLISDYDSLCSGISVLVEFFAVLTAQLRKDYMSYIEIAFRKAISSDPASFIGNDFLPAFKLYKNISDWIGLEEPYTWPSLFSLCLLLPQKCVQGDFIKLFGNMVTALSIKIDPELFVIRALYNGSLAVVQTGGNPCYSHIMLLFNSQIVFAVTQSKIDIITAPIGKEFFEVFPLSLFITEQDLFGGFVKLIQEPGVPMLISCLSKIVCRASELSHSLDDDKIFFEPIMFLLRNAFSSPRFSEVLEGPFRTIERSPRLFASFFERDPCFISLICQWATVARRESLMNAIIVHYGEIQQELNDWTQVQSVTNSLTSFMKSVFLVDPAPFVEKVPEVILAVSECIIRIVTKSKKTPDKQFLAILYDFETTAIISLTSASFSVTQTSLRLLNNISIIIEKTKAIVTMPIAAYTEIGQKCLTLVNPSVQNIFIRNALRLADQISPPSQNAFTIIFDHFRSLSRVVSPEAVNVKTNLPEIAKPTNVAREEWANSMSILLLFPSPIIPSLLVSLYQFLQTRGFAARKITECIPYTFPFSMFPTFISYLYKWSSSLRNSKGVLINLGNTSFVYNASQIVIHILEQSVLTLSFDNSQFEFILSVFCDYADVLDNHDFHFECCQILVLAPYLDINQDVRISISTMITKWISKMLFWQPEGKEGRTGIMCQALGICAKGISYSNSELLKLHSTVLGLFIKCVEIEKTIEPIVSEAAIMVSQNNQVYNTRCLLESCFNGSKVVRSLALTAVSRSLSTGAPTWNYESFLSILFLDNIPLIEAISQKIPTNLSDPFSKVLLEASIALKREQDFLKSMLSLELGHYEEANKNMIFRGNSIPSRAIGNYPRIIGFVWVQRMFVDPIRDLFDSLSSGTCFEINPSLTTPELIESGKKNFLCFLESMLSSIIASFQVLPEPLVYFFQLLNSETSRVIGDYGFTLVNGFCFLRFILPFLTSPDLLQLPFSLSQSLRSVLVNGSVVLMSAINRGDLSNKREYFHFLNNFARKAQNELSQTVFHVLHSKKSDSPSNYDLDINVCENHVLSMVHMFVEECNKVFSTNQSLSSIESKFRILLNSSESIPPLTTKLYEGNSSNDSEDFLNILRKPYPDITNENVSNMFFKVTDSIFVLLFKNINSISDLRPLVSHIFNVIGSVKKEYQIIVDGFGFNPKKLPSSYDIKKLFESCPNSYEEQLKEIIIINSPFSLTEFVKLNLNSLPLLKKVVFYVPGSEKEEIVFNTTRFLMPESQEACTSANEIQNVEINGNMMIIRLHSNSVQVLSSELIGDVSFVHQETILYSNITKLYNIIRKPNYYSFSFSTNTSTYHVIGNDDSQLPLTLIKNLQKVNWSLVTVPHDRISQDEYPFVLFFASVSSILGDSNIQGFDLLCSLYNQKLFKYKLNPNRIGIEQISQKLCELSLDLMEQQPKMARAFYNAFITVTKYVKDQIVVGLIPILSPWIKGIIQDQVIVDNLMYIYTEKPLCRTMFDKSIWSQFKDEKSVQNAQISLLSFRPYKQLQLTGIFASVFPKIVSTFWVEQLHRGGMFSIKVIEFLVTSMRFDIKNVGSNLLYEIMHSEAPSLKKQFILKDLVGAILLSLSSSAKNPSAPSLSIPLCAPPEESNEGWLCRSTRAICLVISILNQFKETVMLREIFEFALRDSKKYFGRRRFRVALILSMGDKPYPSLLSVQEELLCKSANPKDQKAAIRIAMASIAALEKGYGLSAVLSLQMSVKKIQICSKDEARNIVIALFLFSPSESESLKQFSLMHPNDPVIKLIVSTSLQWVMSYNFGQDKNLIGSILFELSLRQSSTKPVFESYVQNNHIEGVFPHPNEALQRAVTNFHHDNIPKLFISAWKGFIQDIPIDSSQEIKNMLI